MKFRALFAGLLFATSGPAIAGFPVVTEMTCPIGGERFEFVTTPSYSVFGSRPDGKPYGSWTFPLALPECPSNGLILFRDFASDELRRLEAILMSDRFLEIRGAGHTQYYRLAWLMREMGEPPMDHLSVLVRAGWETETGTPLRARYLEELEAGMAQLGGETVSIPDFAMRGRRINALRELGRFDEAAELLARTPLNALDAAEGDEEDRQGWRTYYAMLGTLIARRDTDAEPVDFVPAAIAARRCVDEEETLDQHRREFCARDEIRELMDLVRQAERDLARAQAEAEQISNRNR